MHLIDSFTAEDIEIAVDAAEEILSADEEKAELKLNGSSGSITINGVLQQ